MTINFDKVYSQKSNAMRDVRKAVAAKEYKARDLDVSVVPTGYQIGLANPPSRPAADMMLVSPHRAEKVLVRTEAWPFAKAVPVYDEATSPAGWRAPDALYNPADKFQATNLINGETVSVANLHDPIRTVEGDPVKAARKAATKTVKASKAAAKAATKLDAQIGRKPAKPAAAPVKAAAKVNGDLSEDQMRLLTALVDCKAFGDKPLAKRVGVWIKYKAIHDSDTPHNLPKGKLPSATGVLRRHGFLDIRGSSSNGEIMLTAAGLARISR